MILAIRLEDADAHRNAINRACELLDRHAGHALMDRRTASGAEAAELDGRSQELSMAAHVMRGLQSSIEAAIEQAFEEF